MNNLLKKILFIDLIKGLLITFKTIFTTPVTIRYPKQKRPLEDGFRGRHAFVRDPETGKERCVACTKCAQVCPSQCIYIDYSINPETGARVLTKYEIDALRCIFCGYCEEVCPVNAIVLTEYFEYASYTREENYFNRDRLLNNWDEFIGQYERKEYLNKFWYLPGIGRDRLSVGKRQPNPIIGREESQ
ncbi:NADH-quinone oxidoreductase subunit NuoI [Thermodesulfovibrio sp. Kuro-1]|uniref:NADH-quinone oxidoreductase subunit NuoI n=1 Tax=Thermodesulfovibrio TaxID=28261 RepID=UPI0011447FE3|nr:NADH-quinone oxidoreductase subunit NuoI [Thermodesulfovibrio sp. Kuro-1]